MNDLLGWRWAFIVLVPLTIISGILVGFFVRLPTKEFDKMETEEKWRRIDFLGAVVLVTAIVILLVGLNAGGNTVPWFHSLVLVTLPLSAAFFLVFVYVQANYAVEPIIPVKLLLDQTVMAACLTNWFFTMSQISLTFYAPIYFQVQGTSAFDAGIRLIPTSVGAAAGGITCGIIMRAVGKYYVLNLIVQFLFHSPSWPHHEIQPEHPAMVSFRLLFLHGFCVCGYAHCDCDCSDRCRGPEISRCCHFRRLRLPRNWKYHRYHSLFASLPEHLGKETLGKLP